jgi:hypothetical protein
MASAACRRWTSACERCPSCSEISASNSAASARGVGSSAVPTSAWRDSASRRARSRCGPTRQARPWRIFCGNPRQ